MTKSEQICRAIGVVLTRRQAYACDFLERRGQHFGVHFGYHNCERLAADAWVREMDAKPRSRYRSIVRVPLDYTAWGQFGPGI